MFHMSCEIYSGQKLYRLRTNARMAYWYLMTKKQNNAVNMLH